MNKVKVAILGSGNIGSDLMMKLRNSNVLELVAVIGVDPNSDGLRRAKELGYEVFDTGIDGYLKEHSELKAKIIFDATSAKAHEAVAPKLKEEGIIAIDLTPAAVGPFVVPPVNLQQNIDEIENVNMVTCGGQATIPMVHAINRITPVEYAEIVATISSKSAGPGTRANIDEFTETTSKAIEVVGGAKKGKAIIILNPAEPPILMRDTVHALINGNVDKEELTKSIREMEKVVQSYVPGYRVKQDPVYDGNRVSIFIEVEGAGDYLPKYSGNLDIMTSAAMKTAEEVAKKFNEGDK
jgi:acetaldehyde dehydrogenase